MRATIVSIPPSWVLRVVGAPGFEPGTWSTQNSRATRLRYAPPGGREYAPVRYTVRSGPARRPADALRKAVRPAGAHRNHGWATRSPAAIPYFFAGPPITSSTARTEPAEGLIRGDS